MREFFDQNFITPLTNGTTIGEYQIIQCLGQGGFGTTYFCQDTNLNRYCVLKEFTPQRLAIRKQNQTLEPIFKKRFISGLNEFMLEAQHIALFNHPNIVKINRYFNANETGYYVMDYESGISLRQLINTHRKGIEEYEIELIILPLCDGLSQLHKKSMIHRDIKPDNIIIRVDGTPILIDFGAVGDLKSIDSSDYKIYVTPHYAPPEQFNPKYPQGPWIDIYALGATLYELIAGYPPQSGLNRLKNDEIESVKQIGSGKYSIQLLELIEKSLILNYEERPKSIDEFLNYFRFDKYKSLKNVVHSISLKATQHFLNWAKPNNGLVIEEFVSFITGFSIIDLTWRLGKGKLLDKTLFDKIIDEKLIDEYLQMMKDAGFKYRNIIINKVTVRERLEEYAATYLLDRQEANWTYDITIKHCAKYCISKEFENDKEGFMDLLGAVVDRYRGRIKKELRKLYFE